jgi:predicted GIY-YIG superfamily endonuclease
MAKKPLSEVVSKKGREKWQSIEADLPRLLDDLWNAPGAKRLDHDPPAPEEPGLYLFVEHGKPIYVGQTRNLRSRLAAHRRPSGSHNSASFAFLIAKTQFKGGEGKKMTRVELQSDPDFKKLFDKAKKQVSEMEIRFILCEDPELRTVFEVYAAEHLGTKKYNSFETH